MARKTIEEANHGVNRMPRKGAGGPADYACMDGSALVKHLEQLTNWGCAIRFGKTKDGGAFALGIYGVDEIPYTEFLTPNENPGDYIKDLVEWMEAAPVHRQFPALKPVK